MPKCVWDPQRVRKLRELVEADVPQAEMVKILGLRTVHQVRVHIHKLRLSKRPAPHIFEPDDDDLLRDFAALGYDATRIQKAFAIRGKNLTIRQIRGRLAYAGIRLKAARRTDPDVQARRAAEAAAKSAAWYARRNETRRAEAAVRNAATAAAKAKREDELREMARAGVAPKDLARHFGITTSGLRRWRRRIGITTDAHKQAWMARRRAEKEAK